MELKCNKFKIRRTTYKNAISRKFDNRRITIIKKDNGNFGIDFLTVDKNQSLHSNTIFLRGKVVVTQIELSQEGAEIVMFTLAEIMGLEIINKT